MKRPRVPVESRWKQVALDVLAAKLEVEERRTARTDERDVIGDHVTKILNQNPGFRWVDSNDFDGVKMPDGGDNETFHPFFSSRNFRRIYGSFKTLGSLRQNMERITQKSFDFLQFLIKDRHSVFNGVWTLFWFSVLVSLLLALAFKAMILWCSNAFIVFSSVASLFLVDINDFKAMCPGWFLSAIEVIQGLLRWTDQDLFLGRFYEQRDWNVQLNSQDAASEPLELHSCPPSKVYNNWWARRAQKHASAINFSHSMIKQQKGKQMKKNKKTMRPRTSSLHCEQGSVAHDVIPEEKRKTSNRSLRSRHMSLDDAAGIWKKIDQTIGASTGRDYPIVERTLHVRVASDDSSTTRKSFSDSDVFSANDSDDDYSSARSDCARVLLHDGKDPLLSTCASENGDDMDWVEVGARIGMRILSSEHVHRAVASQDTAERILDISKKVEKKFGTPKNESVVTFDRDNLLNEDGTSKSDLRSLTMPVRPVHSLWTSASALGPASRDLTTWASDTEDLSEPALQDVPALRRLESVHDDNISPPRLPLSLRKSALRRQGSNGSSPKYVSFDAGQKSRIFPKDSSSQEIHFALKCVDDNIIPHLRPSDALDVDMGVEVVLSNEKGDERESIRPTIAKVADSPMKTFPKRMLLQRGVKIVVPMLSIPPKVRHLPLKGFLRSMQMATVVSSKRIFVRTSGFTTATARQHTNCLSITVNLDKSFLRDGAFAQMTLRIMDAWSDRYVPRHSKFPIGACVATSYGIGILVGWRVEDDCHIVRALWQRRGPGSANAYLNRHALHCIVEAAIGFPVDTTLGKGVVLSCFNAGQKVNTIRYFVRIDEIGRYKGKVLEFNRCEMLACHGPEFVPIIELIREAAEYQIQVDTYKFAMQNQMGDKNRLDDKKWQGFAKGFEIIWSSLLKAVEDEEGFDAGVNQFFSSLIGFLDQLEKPGLPQGSVDDTSDSTASPEVVVGDANDYSSVNPTQTANSPPFTWLLNDLFGGIFSPKALASQDEERDTMNSKNLWNQHQYDNVYAVIRALMRTTTIARAECNEMPELKLGLSIVYEFLLFVRTLIKIQQKNVSSASLAVWERAIDEIVTTFGPVQVRFEKIAQGIADRMKRHGKRAKIRLIRLVDILASDEVLLLGLERGEWNSCLEQVEIALVQAGILTQDTRLSYQNTIKFIFNYLAPATKTGAAATRNNEKMIQFAKALKWFASPRRSLLKLIRHNTTLETLQRIFDRVFRKDPDASLMIFIHASNMTTMRHLRMLKDFTISGKLWIPLLEAADQEFLSIATKMPEKSRRIMLPLSKLFSLAVDQFHKIADGDLTADWMDFLIEDEAVKLIHQIDVELILQVESFSKDVKEVMVALPFFPSIDDDILNLVDEFDINLFVKEASAAMTDRDQLLKFIRDKSTIAIQRFLGYLPKMSIPVEQRELGNKWVITCRSESGGDLKLSDVCISRENLICRVMGGETIMIPSSCHSDRQHVDEVEIVLKDKDTPMTQYEGEQPSIIDEIRALLLNAQRYGCWESGFGGVGHQVSDPFAASILQDVPVSTVLNAGIELWRNLEIDDDELLEIAIKDVSFQIQLNQQREEGLVAHAPGASSYDTSLSCRGSSPYEDSPRRRFNPRVDPTLLYLNVKKLSVTLDKFHFRIEKAKKTIFDPVFEGFGRLCVENVSITIQVDCRKEPNVVMGEDKMIPVLHCQELSVSLENVILEVSDTGADWVLNQVVKKFSSDLSRLVESNLQDQVRRQVHKALENLNAYLLINPDILLNILGIRVEDLEENVVWV